MDSVKAIRYQIRAIHDALINLTIETRKTYVQFSHAATSPAEQLKDLIFIVWYEIFLQILIFSIYLQLIDNELDKITSTFGYVEHNFNWNL